MTEYEPNELRMILNATKMLCETLIKETMYKTPKEKHEVAEMLMKAIQQWEKNDDNRR